MNSLVKRKFFFIRHGKTDWNEMQLCQGQLDIELNHAGYQEAILLGESIKHLPVTGICTSPLKRAWETAKIIQSFIPTCEIQAIDELKERHWGELEGISSLEMYRIEEMEEKDPNYQPGRGVEPKEVFKSRILRGINIALEKYQTPLIVSHGRLFLSLCEILNLPPLRQIPNATLITCVPENHHWILSFTTNDSPFGQTKL